MESLQNSVLFCSVFCFLYYFHLMYKKLINTSVQCTYMYSFHMVTEILGKIICRYSKKPFHCFVCTVTLFLRITIRQDRTPVATHLPLAFTKSSPQACASRSLPWQLNINTRAGHTPQIVRQSGTVRLLSHYRKIRCQKSKLHFDFEGRAFLVF